METLYRKVFIKSEQDLPKEDGFYIVSCKDYAVLEYHYCSEVKRDWLKEVDWYLHPIEPQEPDSNTPFFGNSGTKIPIQQKQTAKEIQVKIGKILDNNLQLDMPRPMKAKMQVVREIMKIIYQNQQPGKEIWGIIDHRIPPMAKTPTFEEWMEYAEQIFKQSEQPEVNVIAKLSAKVDEGEIILIEKEVSDFPGEVDIKARDYAYNLFPKEDIDSIFARNAVELHFIEGYIVARKKFKSKESRQVSDKDYRKHGRAT